jgi:FHS family L-fucose permease-like MFS transporter
LFVIACGLTFLETSGLGIIGALGSPERLEWRINLASAFNSLGSIVGILLGRQSIFSGVELTEAQRAAMDSAALASHRASEAHAVQPPYAIIGITVLAWAIMVACTRFPASAAATDRGSPFAGLRALLRSRMFVFGVITQFLYVGTQIGIWSFLIRYAQQTVPGMPEQTAALYLTLSLVVFMIARFISTAMLRYYSSAQLGAAFAAASFVLTGVAVTTPGYSGLFALVGVSFFMSVMFPAIYSIGLAGNSQYAKPASALMIMSITGGAVLTAAMGAISDHATIALAFVVPMASFAVIAAYCGAVVYAHLSGTTIGAAH